MKHKTKIQLLPFEVEMICDTDIILTKNAIMQKLKMFLEEIQLQQKKIIEKNIAGFPEEVLKTSPKVSRGENYKGLPWLVLDYPRHFEPGNIFAIRTMFWWGKFFSITLHLSGRYKELLVSKIIKNKSRLAKNDYYICISKNEWEHNFDADNYKKVSDLSGKEFEEISGKKIFLKLAKKFSLNKTAEIESAICSSYEVLVKLIF